MNDKTTVPGEKRELGVWRNSPWGLLRRDFNRVIDSFFEDMHWPTISFGHEAAGPFNPKIDVSEKDKEICVVAELPGLDEKDVSVVVDNDILVIKGEKKSEHESKDENFHMKECSYGMFRRSVALPAYIDRDKVEAKFKKGVLTVTIPKTAEAAKQQKKIEIKAA